MKALKKGRGLHKVCRVRCPVRSIFAPHIQSFFPQLPSEGILEAAEDKHHPLQQPVEWDLLCALGFGFLLFGFGFRFGLTVPLLVSSPLCW